MVEDLKARVYEAATVMSSGNSERSKEAALNQSGMVSFYRFILFAYPSLLQIMYQHSMWIRICVGREPINRRGLSTSSHRATISSNANILFSFQDEKKKLSVLVETAKQIWSQ